MGDVRREAIAFPRVEAFLALGNDTALGEIGLRILGELILYLGL